LKGLMMAMTIFIEAISPRPSCAAAKGRTRNHAMTAREPLAPAASLLTRNQTACQFGKPLGAPKIDRRRPYFRAASSSWPHVAGAFAQTSDKMHKK